MRDQVVIVTGAGRGIGREIALAAGRGGAHVVLVARSSDQLEAVADEVAGAGGVATVMSTDVTDPDAAADVVRKTLADHDRIDALVNNAGTNHVAPLIMTRDEDVRRVYEVNVFSVFHLTRLVLRPMIKAKYGRILNVASVAGKIGARFNSIYASSKAAVLGLTKSVALETASYGITVNAVCPWFVDTELLRESMATRGKLFGADAAGHIASIVESSTQGRLIEAHEVASLAVFLMSREASGISGQCVNVCGGNVTG